MAGRPFKVVIEDRFELVGRMIKVLFDDATLLTLEFDHFYESDRESVLRKAEIIISDQAIDLMKPVEDKSHLIKCLQYLNVVTAFELIEGDFGPENTKLVLALMTQVACHW